jgi:hypothetical protein
MARRSIAGLMILVALLAIGIAALSRPTRLWGAVLFSSATALFLIAAIVAIFGSRRERAFCAGFAITGTAYLLLQYGPWCETQVGPHTLPTAVLDLLYPVVASPPAIPMQVAAYPSNLIVYTAPVIPGTPGVASGTLAGGPGATGGGPGSAPFQIPFVGSTSPWGTWTEVDLGQLSAGLSTPSAFYRIGHSILSLVAALVGGAIARAAARRNEQPAVTTA